MSEQNQKNIDITIQTHIIQDHEERTFEFDASGVMTQIKGNRYLKYKEPLDGIDKPVSVTVKLGPDNRITIIRSGEVRMKLLFEVDKRLETYYQTPFGTMYLSTQTRAIERELASDSSEGSCAIYYDLYQGEELMGTHTLKISFKEQ